MPPDSQPTGLVCRPDADVAQGAVAHHPGGPEHLARIDREIASMMRHRKFVASVLDPLFAWPFVAALTQLLLG